MIRLVRAEFLKLRSTQTWFWLLLAAVAIAAVFVIGPIASSDVHNGSDVAQMFGGASVAYIVVFVLGVLGVTTEFRYQTITPTLLQTPSRWLVVGAKMITYATVGVLFSAVCLAIQLAIAVPWLAAKNVHYSLGSDHIPRELVAVLVVVALFGIVGLGVGALLRNQIVAVTVGVIFLVALQNIVDGIPGVKHAFPYLPAGAVLAITAVTRGDRNANGVELFPVWGGVVTLLLWAFVPAIVGAAYTMNRDIT